MEQSLFPACAGVIPGYNYFDESGKTFPRMCGGDPGYVGIHPSMKSFSPHVRG